MKQLGLRPQRDTTHEMESKKRLAQFPQNREVMGSNPATRNYLSNLRQVIIVSANLEKGALKVRLLKRRSLSEGHRFESILHQNLH